MDFASWQPMRVPYLEKAVSGPIPIDVGRQLFVDDFLTDRCTMSRVFHQPVKHPGNPVLAPVSDEERHPDFAPCAVAKCGGVSYDDRDERFKMWYMAGYTGSFVYAESSDGINWDRPELDVVAGTNICLPRNLRPDSGTVVIDHDATKEEERFKLMLREPNDTAQPLPNGKRSNAPALMMTSPDGIHWSEPVRTGPMGDRSTAFYNPFRKKWVQSIRGMSPRGRCRLYREHDDFFESGRWEEGEPLAWVATDCMDQAGDTPPQLYTVDAVAYESIMLGLFQIHKGPPNPIGEQQGLPKFTELNAAYTRDGFHWHRPDRRALIGPRREPGSWEYGYVEASGGVLLVVGDELWIYYNAYAGDPSRVGNSGLENGMYGNGAVGLAKLRRDGFASLQARIPDAAVRTRLVRFKGKHLFVNANTAGSELRARVLGEDGEPMDGFEFEDCQPFIGNSTSHELQWSEGRTLEKFRDQPVRLQFKMSQGDLFAFWVSPSPDGQSGGYVGAGGPGLRQERDV